MYGYLLNKCLADVPLIRYNIHQASHSHIQQQVCPCVLSYPLHVQVTDMIAEGYPAQQVLLQLQALLVPGAVTGAAAAPDDDTAALSDVQRAKMCELLAAADKDLVDGSDEFLQLLNVAGGMQAEIMG